MDHIVEKVYAHVCRGLRNRTQCRKEWCHFGHEIFSQRFELMISKSNCGISWGTIMSCFNLIWSKNRRFKSLSGLRSYIQRKFCIKRKQKWRFFAPLLRNFSFHLVGTYWASSGHKKVRFIKCLFLTKFNNHKCLFLRLGKLFTC